MTFYGLGRSGTVANDAESFAISSGHAVRSDRGYPNPDTFGLEPRAERSRCCTGGGSNFAGLAFPFLGLQLRGGRRRRFIAVDDCGNIINPMIVEGQIHGGLTEGLAIAFMQLIDYDENGNVQGGSFMDYLLPTAVETPHWETGKTCTPSPHHPFGAKGVGESPNVGSPAAFVNAVVDALSHLGVKHIDMPIAPWKVWNILKEKGVVN